VLPNPPQSGEFVAKLVARLQPSERALSNSDRLVEWMKLHQPSR
jgi:hypothetical protein